MHREAAEAGAAVARFMAHNAHALADLARGCARRRHRWC
jgi:hypothetical protein